MKEAYEAKKWAFVSDYARLYICYTYGGIYFDTDIETIKPFDDLLSVYWG
jgi:mannosyltransferase OCH1-like enzyme